MESIVIVIRSSELSLVASTMYCMMGRRLNGVCHSIDTVRAAGVADRTRGEGGPVHRNDRTL